MRALATHSSFPIPYSQFPTPPICYLIKPGRSCSRNYQERNRSCGSPCDSVKNVMPASPHYIFSAACPVLIQQLLSSLGFCKQYP